jgi:hypothetical protein
MTIFLKSYATNRVQAGYIVFQILGNGKDHIPDIKCKKLIYVKSQILFFRL